MCWNIFSIESKFRLWVFPQFYYKIESSLGETALLHTHDVNLCLVTLADNGYEVNSQHNGLFIHIEPHCEIEEEFLTSIFIP